MEIHEYATLKLCEMFQFLKYVILVLYAPVVVIVMYDAMFSL